MSSISTYLSNILNAVYGRDVRQSIHDSIEQCYTDVNTAKTLADNSVATMNQRITDCNTAADGARSAVNTANASASNADSSASSANTAASTANAAAEACNTAVTQLPGQVTDVFADLGLTMQNGKLCVEVVRE